VSVQQETKTDPKTGESRKVWVVNLDYYDLDGKRHRVSRTAPVASKRAAERFERDIIARLGAGTYRKESAKKKKKTIPILSKFETEFIRCYSKVNHRPSTTEAYESLFRRYLIPLLGGKKLDEIRAREIENLKAELVSRGLANKTVNNATGVLSKALNWAVEMEIIDSAPHIRKLRTPEPEFDYLEFDEAERLQTAAKYNLEWYMMILFTLRTGLRWGELSELRWGDVDLVKGQVCVRRSVWRDHIGPPKNGKNREIPISDETVTLLKEHKARKSKRGQVINLTGEEAEKPEARLVVKDELVFSKANGTRHIHRRGDVAIKRCCKKAGLRLISWHTLRHTFASHLAMRGRTLLEIKELLGHSTIQMTMRYAHLSPNVRREAVETLDSGVQAAWQKSDKSSEDPMQKEKSPGVTRA